MKTLLLLTLTAVITTTGLLAGTAFTTETIPPLSPSGLIPPKKIMKAFRSEAELAQFFRKHPTKRNRMGTLDGMVNLEPATAGATGLFTVYDGEQITNVQHAGVDEGGIVKVHGDHLVILRRGRLFTVKIDDAALEPISAVDAFGPDMDPNNTWYDEMLVTGNTVIVIGYSYERGGTEVGLFDITASGRLLYRSTYNLRSNDYFSSRNYASRLIGDKLIFYAPQYLYQDNPLEVFPAVRRWHKGATADEFRRIVPATRVYQTPGEFDSSNSIVTLHTVTVCDLANGGFDCQGTSVLGPEGHVFYVSPDAVYVWASSWGRGQESMLFRMPLDGSGPSALRTSGSPVDQFSFLQSDDQNLNVLVRSNGNGDGMWAAEVATGDVALMRIPIVSFSDGNEAVPVSSYRPLQKPRGYGFQNRFVGNYVIYGTGSGWGYPQKKIEPWQLMIADWRRGNAYQLPLPHGVDRIEQMGADAVIVGTAGVDLYFSSVRLGQSPEVVSRYARKEASQGELRSHGFFYKPDGENSGTLGLPISFAGRPGYKHLTEDSAAILFLRNEGLQFREVGELGSQPEKAVDDRCRASCIDWYGNARPLFLRGRVFALLGYEIVEGKLSDGRIQELRRVNYLGADPHG